MRLADVETPALVVDLDRLRSNVDRMATMVRDRGASLRPHTKTHKCLEIAELQRQAGARGLTVATLSEAEVFAGAGFTDLFVAYPVYARGGKAERIRRLLDSVDLSVGVDSPAGAATLAEAARGRPLPVVLEVDSGQHRTGVPARSVLQLAQACDGLGLDVRGVFTHGGHAYADPSAPPLAAADEVAALTEAAERLRAAGFDLRTVSAGSTPTSTPTPSPDAAAARASQVTEERPGTYVFQDRQQLALGACEPSDLAVSVAATVVSVHDDRIILDAGSKALAGDRPGWLEGAASVPALADAPVTRLSEHHGVVDRGSARWAAPEVGDLLLVAPNHACTVVNLFDEYVVTQDGAVVDRWRVAARGRNT